MTSEDDEEDEVLQAAKDAATRWRNAFWAQIRAHQAMTEAREDAAGYGGSFRAIRQPRPGAQSVHPEDTTGSYDFCWCGLPADHDWPGKSHGRKHPKVTPSPTSAQEEAVAADAPYIDRRHLRTYHADLIDVIMRAVNDYGVRYRMTSNSVLLYPPDGTKPYTVYARNSDRQAKAARKWFIEHVLTEQNRAAFVEPTGKGADRLLDDMEVKQRTRELAEKINSPEHEVPVKETSDEKRTRKSKERREAVEKMAAAAVPPPARPPGDWRPFVAKTTGVENPNYETNGKVIRCRECGWATEEPRALGGHWLTHHSEEHKRKLWGADANAKKVVTKQQTAITAGVEEAIRVLRATIGQTEDDTGPLKARVTDLLSQVNRLTDALEDAQRDRDAAQIERDVAVKDRDDMKARLDLLREALQA